MAASLSARRAWIEILAAAQLAVLLVVALRKESVDRNLGDAVVHSGHAVALRKESVDRNPYDVAWPAAPEVALRKESVDRNHRAAICNRRNIRSLSARRAWIEIWVTPLSIVDTPCRSPQGERG